MKKLTKQSLDEMAKAMRMINKMEQHSFVGGGNGTKEDPYTFEEYNSLLDAGVWAGGFVGSGYIIGEVTVTASIPREGRDNSYYIGPTSDGVLNAMPTPTNAADYIAQQHDIEYQQLGLSGFSGSISSASRDANDRLMQRCQEVIDYYIMGIRTYHGYPITEEAFNSVVDMQLYFGLIGK